MQRTLDRGERPPMDPSACGLRSHGSYEVLVEERRDDERMIRKPRVLTIRSTLALLGKCRERGICCR